MVVMQARQQVLPKRIAQLAAGLFETSEGITRSATIGVTSPPTNLAAGDILADIGFGGVGMQWQLRSLKDAEQLWFMGTELL